MKTEYYCKTYNLQQVYLCFVLPYIVLNFCAVYLAIQMRTIYPNGAYKYIGLFVLFAPLVLQNYIRQLFIRRANITLDEEGITITKFNNNNDLIYQLDTIKWCDIATFFLVGNGGKVKRIYLTLENRGSKKIIFYDYELNENALADDKHLFRIFCGYVKRYNNMNNGSITCDKGPLNSKRGKRIHIVVSLTLFCVFIINLILEPRTCFYSASILIFFNIGYYKTKQQGVDIYNKLMEM